MRRKLVKQSASTLTVSLPKVWVNNNDLKPNEEVEIEFSENNLVVKPLRDKVSQESTVFNFSKVPVESVRLVISAIYKSGYKDLKMININKEKVAKIEQFVKTSIGFEILDVDKDSMRIVDVSNSDEIVLEKAEQQVYWKILNILEELKGGPRGKDYFYDLDMEVNRLCFFIQRNLITQVPNTNDIFHRYDKIAILEDIGDAIRDYGKVFKKEDKTMKYVLAMTEIFDELRKIHSNKDFNKIMEIRDKLKLKKAAFKKETSSPQTSALGRMINRIDELIMLESTLNLNKLTST